MPHIRPNDSLSRRRFGKLSAAALGYSMIPTAASRGASADSDRDSTRPKREPPRPQLPDDEKLGIALVGLGNYATNQLRPALEETGFCKLSGIVTGTPQKAVDWTARYPELEGHVYNYETYDRIADDDAIDVIYVVLPNSMHAEYTVRAAEAGKHVICEKPMALTADEAQTMIDACDGAERRLFIGYRLHFEPHNMEAMRRGQSGALGNIKVIENAFGFRIGEPTQWRLKMALAGGGAMMDVGIYALQAARYVTGEEPVEVTAQEFKTDPQKFAEVDETLTWQMTFPSGCVANCGTSYATYTERLYASGDRGWIELRPSYGYGGIAGRASDGPLDFPAVNQQAHHMDGCAQAIMNGEELRCEGREGWRDLVVIDAIYESIRNGGAKVRI